MWPMQEFQRDVRACATQEGKPVPSLEDSQAPEPKKEPLFLPDGTPGGTGKLGSLQVLCRPAEPTQLGPFCLHTVGQSV